jgi:hypothetical protein
MKKGTTLVELILYMGLLSVFLVIMSQLFVSSMGYKQESGSFSSVEEDGRFIISRLMYDSSRATSVITPNAVGIIGNQLVLNINGTDYTYVISGSNFTLNNGVTTANLNSNLTTLTEVSFNRVSNTHIKIDFTLQSVDLLNGQPKVKSFTTTVGQR